MYCCKNIKKSTVSYNMLNKNSHVIKESLYGLHNFVVLGIGQINLPA